MRRFVVIDALGGVAGEDVAACLDGGQFDDAALRVVVHTAAVAVPFAVRAFVEVDVVLPSLRVAVAEVQGVGVRRRGDGCAVAVAGDAWRGRDGGGVTVGDADVGARRAGLYGAVVAVRGDGEGFQAFVCAVTGGGRAEGGAALSFADGDGLRA